MPTVALAMLSCCHLMSFTVNPVSSMTPRNHDLVNPLDLSHPHPRANKELALHGARTQHTSISDKLRKAYPENISCGVAMSKRADVQLFMEGALFMHSSSMARSLPFPLENLHQGRAYLFTRVDNQSFSTFATDGWMAHLLNCLFFFFAQC